MLEFVEKNISIINPRPERHFDDRILAECPGVSMPMDKMSAAKKFI